MTQIGYRGVGTGRIPEWSVADRLRKARESAGMDQIDLAREMGVGRATVSNYERGLTAPRRPVLLAWSVATGIDLAWLTEGEREGGLYAIRDSNPEPADLWHYRGGFTLAG